MNKPLLFLTGCIDPNNMSLTNLQNTDSRKKQYLESIKYYLRITDLPILFVENSGNDISVFFKDEIERGRMEILTFAGNDYNRMLGKGYGEMLILDHAIAFSELFKQADFIFKITGRYKILNFQKYLTYYTESKESIDIMVNFRPNLSFADSRIFGSRTSFYKDFLVKYKDTVNDSESVYFEHVLSKAVHEALIEGYKYSGLYYYPRFSGVSGTDDRRFNDSWLHWIIRERILQFVNIIQKRMLIR